MRFSLLFLLICFGFRNFGQKPVEITVADGLSHPYVYQIYQTKDGYLWISTNGGLNRYDGYDFQVFQPDSKNPFSISDEQIKGIFEDHKGRLWLSTQNKGLNVFDRIHNKFYHCELKSKVQNKVENIRAFEIIEDLEQNLWVSGGQSTVFKIEVPKSWADYPNNADFTKEVKITPIPLAEDKKDVRFMILDNSTVWAGNTSGKVFKINTKTLQKTEVFLPFKSENNSHQAISGIYKDVAGNIWISALNEGIYRITNDKIEKINHPAISNFDYHYWLDKTGFVWLKTTENKVYRIFCKDFPSFNFTKSNPIFLSKSKSYKTFPTTPENVLFVGDVRGIKKIDIQEKQIKHLLPETDFTEVFRTRKGENLVSGVGETTFYNESVSNPPKQIFPEIIRARFHQSKNGEIWAACLDLKDDKKYLFHYSENFQFIESFLLNQRFSNPIPVLTEDFDGNIWIAASLGTLHKFDIKTKQITTFDFKNVLPPLTDVHVTEPFQILQTPDKTLWIATEDGLVEVKNIESNRTFRLRKIAKNDNLKGTEIYTIASDPFDPTHFLWLGTKDFGLVKMNIQTEKCEFFTKTEGLPSNNIVGILPDQFKNFWVSTNRGLFRFNPASKVVNKFTRNDGLQGELYNRKAFYKTTNGELVFGGNNGFNVINPDKINDKLTEPNVKIVNIEVNNKQILANDGSEILEKNIENSSEIELKYSQNTIKIFFSVLDFRDSENNIFRYQLKGIDKTMVEAGTDHSATYVSLPIGSYIFKLFGSNRGGNWNKKPITLKIIVLPPWYRTWWAYLLYVGVVSYIVYRFYQFQINKVKLSQELAYEHKERERLAELDQAKTNFFANISHEFRTPLTLILAPIDDFIKKNPSVEGYYIIKRNANRLLQLINQVLDLSKLEANQMSIDEKEVELKPFFRRLTSAFSSIAESKNLDFKIEIFDENYLAKFDMDKIEKVINNLLSNAFKFTEKGEVSIKIDYESSIQNLKISVHDTGVGIPKEKIAHIFNRFYQIDEGQNRRFEGTGIGLALVKELVEVMKGQIRAESEEGIGTTFEVVLPIKAILIEKNDVELESISIIESSKSTQIADYQPSNNENLLLIVDDNADIRTYLGSIFESEFGIIEATNGLEGIIKATKFIPNLIISDLMMPEMDGFEFCKNLKSDEKTSHIPIIMLTAKANLESRIEGFELGADDYLLKPFNTDEVKVRVKNLLKKQMLLQQYFAGRIIDLKPNEVKVNSQDEAFLKKIKEILERNLAEGDFGAEQFAEEMNLSHYQLSRKLKALTNQNINEFIRDFRLQRAADLLTKKAATVSEIAYQVGYENLSYFTKSFKDKFGKLPSEY